MDPNFTREWHGSLGRNSWQLPVMTEQCDEDARPGYHTEKAHEYADTEEVLHEKVHLLAELMKVSSNCLIYSGAGLSTASGIGDYATKSKSKFAAKKISGYAAQPTYAHRALVAMFKEGLIKHWIQQNHDGLPQKAGLPQEYLNEIHGAWYDPTNPVVPMKGSLRGNLFDDLLRWEDRTDLTISVGTSMCGMNADRVFTTVAEKSHGMKHRKNSGTNNHSESVAIGGVIIGIQKTQYDSLACLHIFCRIDRVMELLLQELNIEEPPRVPYEPDVREYCTGKDQFLVAYDEKGRLSRDRRTKLDLRVGSRIKMVSGPYKGDKGVITGIMSEGHYKMEFTHTLDYRKCETVAPYRLAHIMGCWYAEAAVKGTLPEIPVVNCN